jgi:hypothetical protein
MSDLTAIIVGFGEEVLDKLDGTSETFRKKNETLSKELQSFHTLLHEKTKNKLMLQTALHKFYGRYTTI